MHPMFHRFLAVGGVAAAAGSVASAMTLYIDPVNGNDAADGSSNTPWKSFEPLNQCTLQAGDEVVVFPGVLTSSLAPQGNGTAENPVKIHFRPGRYDWMPEGLVHRRLYISNTNDRPDEPKAIAMEFSGVQHYRVCGQESAFFCRGKMIEIHLEECHDVSFSGFSYDYVRPTVNEYTAVEVTPEYVELELHPDSLYTIREGKLIWVGEGWEFPAEEGWAQTLSPDKKAVRRDGPKIAGGTVEEVAPRRLRLYGAKNQKFEKGRSYQHRRHVRDCCGVFCDRSSAISYKDVTFHFMHGMGVVSQFSRDLHFDNLRVYPRPETGRTASAWADVTHFSGCYGQITLENCYLTGANDDAINIHGTHLRLMGKQDDRHITLRFMHGHTFGFNAFRPGDEVQYTSSATLQKLGSGKVAEATLSADGKEMYLVMEEPIPAAAEVDKTVLENVTATAAVTVRNTHVTMIDTRGFLLTTRKPILIENCYFHRTGMPALLMENDANYWYESGPVHNMTIRGCTFDHCAEPVISFNPQVQQGEEPIHRNIRIEGNRFILDKDYYLDIKWVDGLISAGNVFEHPEGTTPKTTQKHCRGVDITD